MPQKEVTTVEYGEYKGHPTITLPCNGRPFTFVGIAKARAIVKYIDEIRAFLPPSERGSP